MLFTQTLHTARDLVEVVDRDGCTRITTGGRDVERHLPLGDIRTVSDQDNRPWLITVVNGEVTAGFLIEDTFTQGELVICMAEEEGLGACPGLVCRHPRQACRQAPDWHEPSR
jgi:hypothetical protein